MLIHKESLGVLDQYWPGDYTMEGQERVPRMVEYTLAGTGLSPDDWWEVPRRSQLGRQLRASYPWCDPVMDDQGQLIDIVAWPVWRRDGLPEPPAETPREPPKKRRQRRRNKGILSYLWDEERSKEK